MRPDPLRVVVVDASAFVAALTRPDDVGEIAEALEDDDAVLHVPEVCDLEVPAALRKGVRAGRLDDGEAAGVFREYFRYSLARHGHLLLLDRVFSLRANFSPYDAVYVALAEGLDAELVTADKRLARAVVRHTDVRVIAA